MNKMTFRLKIAKDIPLENRLIFTFRLKIGQSLAKL